MDGCAFGSVQFSLDWRNLIRNLGDDEPYFVVAKENNDIVGVLPLYYCKNKFGNVLTTNVWDTISGVLCSRHTDPKKVHRSLIEYSISLAQELDCTVLSMGTNPFQGEEEFYFKSLQPDYIMENFVQYMILDEIYDQDGKPKHPNYLRRSNLSRNLEMVKQQHVIISDEQREDNVDQCFKIHERRMRELGAAPYPKSFFDHTLHEITLRGHGNFLFAFYEQRMIAGCLFFSNQHMIDVYMMCRDSDFNSIRANFALTLRMLEYARENRIPLVHWMSSPQRGGGVYRWKEQWGSHGRTFYYLTKVIGDISFWKEMPLTKLSSAYRHHYLLPFNLLNGSKAKFTTKDELTLFMHSLLSKEANVTKCLEIIAK